MHCVFELEARLSLDESRVERSVAACVRGLLCGAGSPGPLCPSANGDQGLSCAVEESWRPWWEGVTEGRWRA